MCYSLCSSTCISLEPTSLMYLPLPGRSSLSKGSRLCQQPVDWKATVAMPRTMAVHSYLLADTMALQAIQCKVGSGRRHPFGNAFDTWKFLNGKAQFQSMQRRKLTQSIQNIKHSDAQIPRVYSVLRTRRTAASLRTKGSCRPYHP